MKIFIKGSALLALLFMVASTLHAQFSQGTKTIGGGISFETRNQEKAGGNDSRNRYFDLNLAGGYLIQDDVEAGLGIGFYSEFWESEQGIYENRVNIFSIGPYVRLYNSITDVVGLFGQADLTVGFGGGRNEMRNGPTTQTRISSFDLGMQPGVILMVNENLGLEAMIGRLGYSRRARGNKDNYDDTRVVDSSFRASFNLRTVAFGFRLYLRD